MNKARHSIEYFDSLSVDFIDDEIFASYSIEINYYTWKSLILAAVTSRNSFEKRIKILQYVSIRGQIEPMNATGFMNRTNKNRLFCTFMNNNLHILWTLFEESIAFKL